MEPFAAGVVVASDDVTADHAALLVVAGVAGAVQGDGPQRGHCASMRISQDAFAGGMGDRHVVRLRPGRRPARL